MEYSASMGTPGVLDAVFASTPSVDPPMATPVLEPVLAMENDSVLQPMEPPAKWVPAKQVPPVEIWPNTLLNALQLEPFLEIGGNQVKNLFFLAIRFKNPVVIPNHIGNNAIRIGKDHCIAVDVNHPVRMASTDGGLVFYVNNLDKITKNLEFELLKTLFPQDSFLMCTFHIRTLYGVSHHNPFRIIWKKMRKTVAFRALTQIYEGCVAKTCPFTFSDAAMMRHFDRNFHGDFYKFSKWYVMAHTMCQRLFRVNFNHEPTPEFGKRIDEINTRSMMHVMAPDHPPREFYTCQITLSDTYPVGIACRIVDDKVEYVSLMIVAHTKEWYLDTNNTSCCFLPESPRLATCRYWFPLFKDKQTWNKGVCAWYMNNYVRNVVHLTALVDWLSIQTAEPYQHMRTDLMQISYILYGSVRFRWT